MLEVKAALAKQNGCLFYLTQLVEKSDLAVFFLNSWPKTCVSFNRFGFLRPDLDGVKSLCSTMLNL